MLPSVFKYVDYKAYIRDAIDANTHIKGYRALVAQKAGCQRSYLSQVLNSSVQLTPDHAANLSDFWKLGSEETEYFLELLQLGRAGGKTLKQFATRRIEAIRERRKDIGHRLNQPNLVESSEHSLYYSNWIWSAIHVLAGVEKYQTAAAMAERLLIPATAIENALQTLRQLGLVTEEDGRWRMAQKSIHAAAGTQTALAHHTNWRQKALINLMLNDKSSLHYTSLHGLSREVANRLREQLTDWIAASRKLIEPSSEEEAICINIDLFKL